MRHTIMLLTLVLLRAGTAVAWTTTVAATPPPAARPSSVAIDAAGDVIAGGRTANAAGDEDGLLVKLGGADGAEQWRKTLTGSAGAADIVRAVTTDDTNVIAVGQMGQSGAGQDALLAKFGGDGTPLWQILLDAGAGSEDDALAVAVDGAGDVLAAGQSTIPGIATTAFTVWKRAGSDGTSVWHTELPGDAGIARAIVRAGNDVIAVGDAAGQIVATRLAGADGMSLWRTDLAGDGGSGNLGRAVALGSGRVVVAGRIVSATSGFDFAVVALDAVTGSELWRVVLDGTATTNQDVDDAFGVAIDAAGDVLAVGRISDAVSDDDLVVMKLAGTTGTQMWRTTVNGNNDNDDEALAGALDAAGDLLVTGTLRNAGTRADLLVAKFANPTGAEQWRQLFNGSENGADSGLAIAVAGTGVVAGGRLRNGVGGDGFVVLERTTANGGDFPCADGTLDPDEACDDGNLATGDGCRGDCTIEACGDGILDPQEACDDGNTSSGDCCSDTCTAETGPCDDGNACTGGETCQAGACIAAATVTCPGTDPCHPGVCDQANGTCMTVAKPDGTPCDDGNACTVLDRCVASTCTGAFSQVCIDGDPCTTDACDPSSGCVYPPLTDFPSIACVFERGVASACPIVPRPVQVRLERAERLVTKASGSSDVAKARRWLTKASRAMQQARRITAAQRRRLRIGADCANVLDAHLAEIATRSDGVRKSLTP